MTKDFKIRTYKKQNLMLKICLIVFLPLIFALPSPRIIYSAIIYNRQNTSIQCQITWRTPENYILLSKVLTIPKHQQHSVDEHLIDMGTWTGRAIIDQVQCESDLVLNAPFDGVQHPSVQWIFVVTSDRIISLGSLKD